MNIWNKVFLGVIFVTSIALAVPALLEMKIRGTGQKHIVSLEKQITDKKETAVKTAERKIELENKVLEQYSERGRAWRGCIVTQVEEKTLPPALQQVESQITITGPPDERGIESNAVDPDILEGVVYVFDEGVLEDGNGNNTVVFLGRFNVEDKPGTTFFFDKERNQKTGYQVTLVTVDPISDVEIEKIFNASQSRWAIYMTPPVDRVAGIFDQLTEEEKQRFPAELLEKFQPRHMPELTDEEKEGVTPDVIAKWEQIRKNMDDPEAESAHDISLLLNGLYRQRSDTNRNIEIAQLDFDTYKAAEEKTKAENEALTEDCLLEEKRKDRMDVQRDAVKNLLEACEKEVAKLTVLIEKHQAMAAAYTAKITEYQLMVVEKIESRVLGNRSQETGDRR